jgi:hypothetical protein
MAGVRFAFLVILVVATAGSVSGQQAGVFYDDFEWDGGVVGRRGWGDGAGDCYDEGSAVIRAGTGGLVTGEVGWRGRTLVSWTATAR